MQWACWSRCSRLLTACAIFCFALSSHSFAKENSSYTQVGHNISIGPNEEVGEVTCVGCSIYIRGQVPGDVTAVAGSAFIEDQAQVAGEVTTVAGDIRVDKAAKIAGDVTVVVGKILRDPQSTISGDVTSMGGRAWIVPILLAPFLILGFMVAFILMDSSAAAQAIRPCCARVETVLHHHRLVPKYFRTPTLA
jgi:hypothetical protein